MTENTSHRARDAGPAPLDSLIDEVLAFHGQPIYASVEAGISRKKRLFRLAFPAVRALARFRLVNSLMLVAVLLGYRVFNQPDPRRAVFQYGLSRNNVLSFERLNACLPEEVRRDISLNGRAATLDERLAVVLALGALWRAAGVLVRKHQGAALPHLQAVIATAAYLFYTRHPLPSSMSVLCIASDHAPVCQALLCIATRAGKRTCYIQHAPVTEFFPPLAYDLSILYDKASARAYARAARRAGKPSATQIAYLPPFVQEFARPHLGGGPYTIGICLSFLPNVAHLAALIDQLIAHPSVKGIRLRRHPRCTMDMSRLTQHAASSLQPRGESADAFFDQVEIVLVPNSGVTIEALHRGRPTFFTPGVDDLPTDYYQFVARRIVPEFNLRLLDDRQSLLAFFDSDWEKRFGDQDESVNKSIAEAQQAVAEEFHRLL